MTDGSGPRAARPFGLHQQRCPCCGYGWDLADHFNAGNHIEDNLNAGRQRASIARDCRGGTCDWSLWTPPLRHTHVDVGLVACQTPGGRREHSEII